MPAPGNTARTPMVPPPPEFSLGPAMKALSKPQRTFVSVYLEQGGANAERAAAAAGYGGTAGSLAQAAHRLTHNLRVQAAMKEEAEKRLKAGSILASSVLIEIASDRMHKDRFKAAVELLNRAGLIVQTEHKVIVEDNRLTDEIVQGIVAMAERLQIDPKKLLGSVPTTTAEPKDVVDAEYTEVDDDISDLMGGN